jgi:hypothetical protein
MKTLVVTTTIKYPQNADIVCQAINHYRYITGNQCDFLVIADSNFRADDWPMLFRLKTIFGFVEILTIEQQKSIFTGVQDTLDRIIFERSVQRRNIGFLYAIKNGYDYIISIDDDNFPADKTTWVSSFFDLPRACVCAPARDRAWVDLPRINSGVISRGFPLLSEPVHPSEITKSDISSSDRVVVVQGLIDGDPDRTALDRYTYPERVVNIQKDDKDVISNSLQMVFNTQNTMFKRDIFPAMFLFPMNKKVGDFAIDRMDDIFMSYIINEIVYNQNFNIAYGGSRMVQRRNDHNLERDMFTELTGLAVAETVLKYIPLEEKAASVRDAYISIAHQLYIGSMNKNDSIHRYIASMSRDMLDWATTLSFLGE